MKNKYSVITRIFGGLGNQLFCYAAARRLSMINGADLVLDDTSGFIYDHLHRREYELDHFHLPFRKASWSERLNPFARIRRYLKREINKRRPFASRSYIAQEGSDFDQRLIDLRLSKTIYLEGYWQSEKYFKDIDSVIRGELSIGPSQDENNLRMFDKIERCQSVFIHVRFHDRTHSAGSANIDLEYYKRAISIIDKRVDRPHYFIFSDQPLRAKICLGLPFDRFTVVDCNVGDVNPHNQGMTNAHKDLALMTKCKHSIIANSTLSWWGAWLSQAQGKLVIAPGCFISGSIMKWGFKGLLPDEWILQ